ncbi:MAG: molybdopterin-dependent oxidoreductase [bacterium]|nr:MAG: molybdopterin-dependent oxidoreductase [bacterium]
MKKINRRDFLKIGTLSATAIQFSGLIPIFGIKGRNVSRFSKNFRKGIPTTCNLCPARCGVLGFRHYEFLAAVQGNPKHINNRGRICARGIAGMNQVYDPDRILHPMKRVGKRGEDKWDKISWDEALGEIFNRLQNISNRGSSERFVFHADKRNITGLTRRFLETLGNPTILTSDPLEIANKAAAQKMTWGESIEVIDASNSRYFLSFGSNPFESHPFYINFNQRIIDGKIDRHARLITIDPRLSNTAGKSDEWIPIKPGTDACLALAMANIIMEKNLYDAGFISQWTNVSVSELKNYLSNYTLQKAAEITQIEAETIERIAVEFATTQPAVAFSGGGVTKHINGTENERCIMLLNAMVGNIDVKGGFCLPRKYRLKDFDSEDEFIQNQNSLEFFDLVNEQKQKVDLYFAYKINPVYEYPNCNFTQEVMKDEKLMPFTVIMDTVMSETAALADLLLPATTFLESWDLDSTPSFDLVPFVSLAQPVIDPPGESKPISDVWIQLASSIGGRVANSFRYEKIEDYIKEIAIQVPGLTPSRDFENLKKSGIWIPTTQQVEYQTYRQQGFKTPSRKFEIAASALRNSGVSPLPKYEPIREHINLAKNELILIPYHVNVLRPDLTNSKWLVEINHTNMALLNPKTARRLKIKQGDKIVLESSIGEIEIDAHITEGIHPEVVAISNSSGHWEFGRIAQAKQFESDDPDTNFIWWEKKGKGTNPNFIIPLSADLLGKGQSWMDTKVKVRKA